MPEFNKGRLFIKNIRKCVISLKSSDIDSVGFGSGSDKIFEWLLGSGTSLSDTGWARREIFGPIHTDIPCSDGNGGVLVEMIGLVASR